MGLSQTSCFHHPCQSSAFSLYVFPPTLCWFSSASSIVLLPPLMGKPNPCTQTTRTFLRMISNLTFLSLHPDPIKTKPRPRNPRTLKPKLHIPIHRTMQPHIQSLNGKPLYPKHKNVEAKRSTNTTVLNSSCDYSRGYLNMICVSISISLHSSNHSI